MKTTFPLCLKPLGVPASTRAYMEREVRIPAVRGPSRIPMPSLRPPVMTPVAAVVAPPPMVVVAVAIKQDTENTLPHPPSPPDPGSEASLNTSMEGMLPRLHDSAAAAGSEAAIPVAVPFAERRPVRSIEKVLEAHKAKLTKIFKFYSNLHRFPPSLQLQPADADLTVGLAAFVQFGQDFNIVPTLLSPQQMRYVYVHTYECMNQCLGHVSVRMCIRLCV
jgi:hypothetical protein